jgi:hypothetical protein
LAFSQIHPSLEGSNEERRIKSKEEGITWQGNSRAKRFEGNLFMAQIRAMSLLSAKLSLTLSGNRL